MQLENLCEKWSGDLGNPANRLSAYPSGPAKPRASWLPSWCKLFWYLYSANRLKYPLMRKRLMKMWREAKRLHSDPVDAWASIIEDADKAKSFKQARGRGGFVRSSRRK